MRKTLANHRGGTVILPTEEPTVQQSNQSTAAPEQTGQNAPASPSATAEASADPTAAPEVTADPSAAPTPATDAEETTAPEATVTPEATATPETTADPSASPSSAPVLKAPMMAPAPAATTTASLEKGQTFNVAIKKLAGNSYAKRYDKDATVKVFKRFLTLPAPGVTTADISASQDGSIVAWFDSSTGTVYWYSKAHKIMLNPDSGYLFYRMTAIENIDAEDFDTSNVKNMEAMFSDCNNLTSLDVSNWNTSNVTDMSATFCGCESLTSLDVSNWVTSNVTHMEIMFDSCKKLTSLDVSNWKTSEVTYMDNMFRSCENLTSLDVSNWDTSKVTTMDDMFHSCENLTSLGVSNWDTSKVTIMDNMFDSCKNLTSLDVSNWDTAKAECMGEMFKDCIGLRSITFGSNFVVNNSAELASKSIFPTPITTVSGVTSNGKWGLGSETASPSYDAVGLGDFGLTSGALEGTWYAQRAAIITFDSNGGTLPDESKSKSVMVDNTYGELPVPTFTDHTFTGWFTSAASDGIPATSDTVCKGDTTLYAHWDAKTYLFKFDINYHKAGRAPDDMPVQFGNPIPQPDLSNMANYEGVIFSGWYLDPECTREFTLFGDQLDKEIVDDYFGTETTLTLYAGWKPNVYSVKFNANGGINAPADQNLVLEKDAIFSPDVKAMTRQGYTFNGWYLDSACKVPFDYFNKKMDENTLSSLTKAGAIDSNDTITLYAGWKAAAAPSATPSATAFTPANNNRRSAASTSNGSIFFPIPSAQKFIPATGAGGGE